jgi:hypothetical protein
MGDLRAERQAASSVLDAIGMVVRRLPAEDRVML